MIVNLDKLDKFKNELVKASQKLMQNNYNSTTQHQLASYSPQRNNISTEDIYKLRNYKNNKIGIQEVTALDKRKSMQSAGIIPFTGMKNINQVHRTITDNKGNIKQGKDLSDSLKKLGKLSNNDYQALRKDMRIAGDHREIAKYKKNGTYQHDHYRVGSERAVFPFDDYKNPNKTNAQLSKKLNADNPNSNYMYEKKGTRYLGPDKITTSIPTKHIFHQMHSHPNESALPSGIYDDKPSGDIYNNFENASRLKLGNVDKSDIINNIGRGSFTKTRSIKKYRKADGKYNRILHHTVLFNYDKNSKYDLDGNRL